MTSQTQGTDPSDLSIPLGRIAHSPPVVIMRGGERILLAEPGEQEHSRRTRYRMPQTLLMWMCPLDTEVCHVHGSLHADTASDSVVVVSSWLPLRQG